MNLSDKIIIHPSKGLARYLWLLLAFASFCTLYALPFYWAISILPGLLFYGRRLLREQAWRKAKSAIALLSHRKGQHWYLQNAARQGFHVTYKGIAFRSPWLIIARFVDHSDSQHFTVVIAKDAVSTQIYTDLLAKLWL